jgi:hypothetical protein
VLKKVRQLIESVNDTLKGQLDLEQHGGRTFEGVAVRVTQRSTDGYRLSSIYGSEKGVTPGWRPLVGAGRGSFRVLLVVAVWVGVSGHVVPRRWWPG